MYILQAKTLGLGSQCADQLYALVDDVLRPLHVVLVQLAVRLRVVQQGVLREDAAAVLAVVDVEVGDGGVADARPGGAAARRVVGGVRPGRLARSVALEGVHSRAIEAVIAAVVGVVVLRFDRHGREGGAAGAELLEVDVCARVHGPAVGGRADQRGRDAVAAALAALTALEQLEGLERWRNDCENTIRNCKITTVIVKGIKVSRRIKNSINTIM